VRELMAARVLQTSTQVFQKLFVTLTRKVRTPMPAEQALRYLDQISAWSHAVIDYGAGWGRVVGERDVVVSGCTGSSSV
jgi:hypothetical protein